MTYEDKIAALERELAELKGTVKASAVPDYETMRKEAAAWQDEMHQLRERRMAHAAPFSREDLRAMEAACSTRDVQDIVRRGAIPERSGMAPSSAQLTGIHPGGGAANVPGGGSGWVEPAPLRPPPGIAMVDAIAIADDVRQRKAKP